MALSRRALLAAAAAPLLARCSSDPNSANASLTHMLAQSLNPFSGGSATTLAEVAGVPFASLGVRVGGGRQTLLVLAAQTGSSTLWTSSSHIALEIQAGRILRTAGLPHDLSATDLSEPDPLQAGLQNLRAPARAKRALDFVDRKLFGIVVESTLTPAGPAEIDVLGTPVKTVHAVESCSSAALAWTFANEYWADIAGGQVWRSSQFIHPDLDAVEIELFRPPKV